MDATKASARSRFNTPGRCPLTSRVGATGEEHCITSWLGGNVDAASGDRSLGLRGHAVSKGRSARPLAK